MLGNPLLFAADDGYQISRSVRTRSAGTAYFSRTPASAGNRQKFTWSGWVKRGTLGTTQVLFTAGTSATDRTMLLFEPGNELRFYSIAGGTGQGDLKTLAVLRDPSAWYHIVYAVDTTQATAGNRLKIYINNVLQSLTTTAAVTLNAQTYINNTTAHTIARESYTGSNYFDGYLTEIHHINGQQLDPTSFGEADLVTGVWKPKKFLGTYGTNGFYLNFSDNSSNTATTIGKDYSGNGNNWTPNNISVTAGATYDSMLDVPTPWADGGNGRGNYATLSPVATFAAGNAFTLSNANLTYTQATATLSTQCGTTIPLPYGSGLFYYEITQVSKTTVGGDATQPFVLFTKDFASTGASYANTAYYLQGNGSSGDPTGAALTGVSTVANGDVLMVAIDLVNGKLFLGKNGTWWNSGNPAAGTGAVATNLANYPVFIPAIGNGGGNMTNFSCSLNFGQQPFTYTKPTGFKALNTQNLPDPTIKNGANYFDVNLWSGNASTQSIVNSAGMQPDFVWIKKRAGGTVPGRDHRLFDAVRGATKYLASNTTNAEITETDGLTSFDSNGFTLGLSDAVNGTTGGTGTYVGWQWKEGATQGFDIVTWTGTGAAQTLSHNLGVAPSMIIWKYRSAVSDWAVGHKLMNGGTNPWNYWAALNTTAAQAASAGPFSNTAPTSTQFTVGSFNANATNMVAYLFAEVPGFSKFGSFIGTGAADGPFIYLGFRLRYLLIKNISLGTAQWVIYDTARNTYNYASNVLLAENSGAELIGNVNQIDFTANGFKIRSTAGATNNSGNTMIYAAFAENPFKYSIAR